MIDSNPSNNDKDFPEATSSICSSSTDEDSDWDLAFGTEAKEKATEKDFIFNPNEATKGQLDSTSNTSFIVDNPIASMERGQFFGNQIFVQNPMQQQSQEHLGQLLQQQFLSTYLALTGSILHNIGNFDIVELKFLSLHPMPGKRETCRIVGVAAGESLHNLYRILMCALGQQEVWEIIS